MRVLMPASGGRTYITTANVTPAKAGRVTLSHISGMPTDLQIETTTDRVLGRKRSGKRGGRRMKGGQA